jgi:hypothetical protein
MTATTSRTAIARIADCAIARTAEARRNASLDASALLAANDNKPPKPRVRYRGTRPAWNWLNRHDAREAAALWLVARGLLPEDAFLQADNDNDKPGGLDMRPSGTPRGSRLVPVRRDFIDLHDTQSPMHPEPEPSRARTVHESTVAVKPQRDVFDFHPDCRFGYCAPAVADGAWFMAAAGLGSVKRGKRGGDARCVEEPDIEIPDSVLVTIEAMLSGATLAGVGEMHGAKGGDRDVKGKVMMLRAGAWAMEAVKERWQALAA